jgi:hypothetical protein
MFYVIDPCLNLIKLFSLFIYFAKISWSIQTFLGVAKFWIEYSAPLG